ncbi:hypothetical protein FISHEDRAFT_46868 [Fistulina hepatica ATCC 64428]|uniref:Uncharacterized protein n=1 Tax=Fistulina hepatica ATCC 64428 TaxID=1128425 RepID=A0A0D7A786_9AGAR|nr:hypothetical protein FISHEDRAFT_46868 [Fistulina hepatica ATCC 64428]
MVSPRNNNIIPGYGPPTREELISLYPPRFTWLQLKTFVSSGDLGLLKRDKALQRRYEAWSKYIKAEYGSVLNYMTYYRLQWGKPDRYSLLQSALDKNVQNTPLPVPPPGRPSEPPTIPAGAPAYFTASTPPCYTSIIQNDWPYCVPSEVEHTLIWTRLPIFQPSLIPESIQERVERDGLWGFTGSNEPPPSPSTLPAILPVLSEWGVTMDSLVRSPPGTQEEDQLVKAAGKEVHDFVRNRWIEEEWETAWFVNPPRLQSIPGLAHIHVFARKKSD